MRSDRQRAFSACFCAILVSSLSACSSKELTRPKAKSILNEKPDFHITSQLPLDIQAFNTMIHDKLWFQPSFGAWWQPTDETKKYFAAVSISNVTLVNPIKREVTDIDGITDGPLPATKVVSFKYH